MIHLGIRLVITCSMVIGSFYLLNAQQIKWLTFEEALEAQQVEQKKIVVDIYTEWCSWCKKMDESTFQNSVIADYINEHYYAVKFDAESKQDIAYAGETYKFVQNGRKGYHELAVELTQGRLSYPTVVFLDEEQKIIQALRGFQSSLRFQQIMTYFARDYYKNTPWSTYCEKYQTPVISKN